MAALRTQELRSNCEYPDIRNGSAQNTKTILSTFAFTKCGRLKGTTVQNGKKQRNKAIKWRNKAIKTGRLSDMLKSQKYKESMVVLVKKDQDFTVEVICLQCLINLRNNTMYSLGVNIQIKYEVIMKKNYSQRRSIKEEIKKVICYLRAHWQGRFNIIIPTNVFYIYRYIYMYYS